MKKGKEVLSQAAPLALFGLVLLTLLALVVLGTGVYRWLVSTQDAQNAQRAQLTYLSAQVHAADAAGAVSVGQGPEGAMLVLAGENDTATRIYLADGWLVEDYAAADAALAPADAQQIAQTETFDAQLDGNVLRLQTDAGVTHVTLRSEEAGSDA